ncbi:MAG: hypothetical protein WCD35_14630, partial [Mycobacteriales bacterium]
PQAAAVASVRRLLADDRRTRLLVGLEAVLLVGWFGLLGQGPLARLARLTGQRPVARTERGVGRFAAVRVGPAPRL